MKRFTDSEQFQDKWFRSLSPDAKLLWFYICHECDNSGVWERDDGLFAFLTGVTSKVEDLLEQLGTRIETLSASKILVPKYVVFQNRTALSRDCPPHRHTLRLLEKHGLQQDTNGLIVQLKGLPKVNGSVLKGETQSKGLPNPLGKGRGKGKGKGRVELEVELDIENKEKRGTGKRTIPETPEILDDPAFHDAWEAYLRHRRQNRWPTHKKDTLANMFEDFASWGLEETVKALRESIRQGWRGVFRQKNEKPQKMEPDRDYENGLKF